MALHRAQRVRRRDGGLSATVLGPGGVVAPVEEDLAFLDDLGRSWHTVRGYASDLALFFDFLAGRGLDWQRVEMPEAAAFSAYLRRTNRSGAQADVVVLRPVEPARAPASVQRTLSVVFGFYDFHSYTALARGLAASRVRRAGVRRGASRSSSGAAQLAVK